MKMQTYKAGAAIPAEWFTKIENVGSMTFGRDVSVTIEDGCRIVRPIGPGEFTAIFHPTEAGGHMNIDAAPPITWFAGDGSAFVQSYD